METESVYKDESEEGLSLNWYCNAAKFCLAPKSIGSQVRADSLWSPWLCGCLQQMSRTRLGIRQHDRGFGLTWSKDSHVGSMNWSTHELRW